MNILLLQACLSFSPSIQAEEEDYYTKISKICYKGGKKYEKEKEIVISYIWYWYGALHRNRYGGMCNVKILIMNNKYLGCASSDYLADQIEDKINASKYIQSSSTK